MTTQALPLVQFVADRQERPKENIPNRFFPHQVLSMTVQSRRQLAFPVMSRAIFIHVLLIRPCGRLNNVWLHWNRVNPVLPRLPACPPFWQPLWDYLPPVIMSCRHAVFLAPPGYYLINI